MGDNKGPRYDEEIKRIEKARLLYYTERFGSKATPFLDDLMWSPYDNSTVAPLHDHRTPFALDAYSQGYTTGLKAHRDGLANGTIREKTPAPVKKVPAQFNTDHFQKGSFKVGENFGTYVANKYVNVDNTGNTQHHSVANPSTKPIQYKPSPPRMQTEEKRVETATTEGKDRELLRSASMSALSRGQSRHSALTGSHASRGGSLKSYGSAASLRSQIQEAVQKEVRSELEALYEVKAAKVIRDRQKNLDRPLHLRTGANPIDAGCPQTFLTAQMRTLQLPIKMATDPKWSTDLKRMNDRIGQRLEWERKMAASLTGSIIPERDFMPPKNYLSVPPTPFFVPGQAAEARKRR